MAFHMLRPNEYPSYAGGVRPKLHYTDSPVISARGHETGKSLTCRRLVGRFHFPVGKLTILTCRDGLPCRSQVRDLVVSCRCNVVWHRHDTDTTFARRPITVHGFLTSSTSLLCANFNMRKNLYMSKLIFNSANLIDITQNEPNIWNTSLNATEDNNNNNK